VFTPLQAFSVQHATDGETHETRNQADPHRRIGRRPAGRLFFDVVDVHARQPGRDKLMAMAQLVYQQL
jgi:hypothetical protein